ncbi:MAG TPA: hypothetical protein VHO48_00300, partial [Anaerolineaceae bacterium]|nr:hypothetical protein [Anaerolineaceae bacterium]
PDSRSLAFANCAPNEPCALIVQNLETRQNRVLALKDERASYQLTQWSADGRYLRVGKFTRSAAIATAEIVLEVATGRVVYEGNAINIAPETIDIEWNEGQFGYSIGLEGCSLAP